MSIVMNNPALNGRGSQTCYKTMVQPTLTGAGWIFKFATEIPGVSV